MIATSQTKSVAVESPTIIERIRSEAEQWIVLHNISWQTFEQILTESGDNCNNRFYLFKWNLRNYVALGNA